MLALLPVDCLLSRRPGGYLVSGYHGHRDGGRRAAVLQRAAAQSHENDPRQPASQTEEPAQGTKTEQLVWSAISSCGCGHPAIKHLNHSNRNTHQHVDTPASGDCIITCL